MSKATWPLHQLDTLTEEGRSITYGVVKPGEHDDTDGVRFVRGGDIEAGKIKLNELRTISQEVSKQYRRTLLRGGELLVSLVGNPGEVAIAPPALRGANIARQVGLVSLHPEVCSQYIMYFLMAPQGRQALFAQTTGSVQRVINLANLKNVCVPLPRLSVQQNIAGILSAYDDLIANDTRRIAVLEEMVQSLYREWFVRFRFPAHEQARFVETVQGRVPEGWQRLSVSALLSFTIGGDWGSEQATDKEALTLLAWRADFRQTGGP